MAGLFDKLLGEQQLAPFQGVPLGAYHPERHPVKPKLPGSKDRNRIDPRRPLRAPTLLKV